MEKLKPKRSKNKRTWFLNAFYRVCLPVYLGTAVLLAAAFLLILEFSQPELPVAYALASICYGYLLFMPVIFALFIMPRMRAKQATLDLAKYNFSPCDGDGDISFEAVLPAVTYYYAADPFDKDECVTLYGRSAAETLACTLADRYIVCDEVDQNQFLPFFYNDNTSDERHTVYEIEKRVEGDILKLKIARHCKLSFTRDGIVAGQSLFKYESITAECGLWYDKQGVQARVAFDMDELTASFAVGTKIYATIKKFGIKVDNGEVLEFIMADPGKAFKAVAKTLSLKKQANYTLN